MMMAVTVAALSIVIVMMTMAALPIMVMVMAVAALPIVIVMAMAALPIVVMMMAVTMATFPIMPVMMLLHHLLLQGIHLLHRLQNMPSLNLFPGRGNNGSLIILLPNHFQTFIQLISRDILGAAQNHRPRIFNLIVIKFAIILHIYFTLGGIHHRGSAVNHSALPDVLYRLHHVRKLPYAGRFNNYPVRRIFFQHLFQSLTEISYQGAADAAGIHLRNLDARLLEKASVNANLSKFILNQNQLLPWKSLGNQLLNQRSLSRTQKTRYNINFCHLKSFLSYAISIFHLNIFHIIPL